MTKGKKEKLLGYFWTKLFNKMFSYFMLPVSVSCSDWGVGLRNPEGYSCSSRSIRLAGGSWWCSHCSQTPSPQWTLQGTEKMPFHRPSRSSVDSSCLRSSSLAGSKQPFLPINPPKHILLSEEKKINLHSAQGCKMVDGGIWFTRCCPVSSKIPAFPEA